METVEIRVYSGLHPATGFHLLQRSESGAPGFISFSGQVAADAGYAEATIKCCGTAQDLQLAKGQRVAFIGYSDGSDPGTSERRVVLWDGLIARITPLNQSVNSASSPRSEVPQFDVKLFGVWREAAKRRGMKRYANSVKDDLAVPFADLLNRFGATGPLAYVTVITTLTGQTSWESLDAYDVTIEEAVSRLSLDSTRLVTGCDVGTVLLSGYDTYLGAPRLFLRPVRSTGEEATHTVLFPDPRTVSATAQDEDTGQATVLRLLGGDARFPNLLAPAVQGNTSFEMPELPGASVAGNLLTNGSFEDGGTDWALMGGASVKDESDEGIVAYVGSKHLELDQITEKATQTKNPPTPAIVEGVTYTLRVRARRIDPAYVVTAEIRIVWLDSGGSTISTDVLAIMPASVVWDEFSMPAIAPAGATGFRCELELTGEVGAGVLDGVLFDAVALFDSASATQVGWELAREGSALVESVRWDEDMEQWHAGRCVYLSVLDCDDGDNQVVLRPIGTGVGAGNRQGTFQVVNVAPIRGGFVVKRRADSAASVDLHVELIEYKSDGTVSTTTGTTTTITGTDWHVVGHSKTPESDATSATLILRFQSDARLYVDAGHVFGQDAPLVASGALSGAVAGSPDRFIEADRYEVTIRAEDIVGVGSPEAVIAAALGEVWTTRSAASVKTDADATLYAQEFFPGSLLDDVRVSVTVVGLGDSSTIAAAGCLAASMPAETLRLLGRDGAAVHPDVEVIQERSFSFQNGQLSTTVTAGLPPRDPTRRLTDALVARAREERR